MKFYVCSTPYHLLISLYLIASDNEKSYIYLSTPDENVYKLFKLYKENIEKENKLKNIQAIYLRKRSNVKERLLLESIIDIKEYKYIKNILKTADVYIFPWHPYGLFSTAEFIFKKSNKVILVEDGANAYIKPKPNKISQYIKKYIYLRDLDFYKNGKVVDVLVQFPDKYPKFINKKRKLELNNIINELEKDIKVYIANIFILNLDLSKIKSDSILLLTQPFSEDKYIKEDEKIKLYKSIIRDYCDGYNVIIKKHPREKTVYNFNNVIEIEGNFPSEIFYLLDIKFKKAIGVCTSAVKTICADEYFNIDEEFLTKV